MPEPEKQTPKSSAKSPIDQQTEEKAGTRTSNTPFSLPPDTGTGNSNKTTTPIFATAPQTKKFHEIEASIKPRVLGASILGHGIDSQKLSIDVSKPSPFAKLGISIANDAGTPMDLFEQPMKGEMSKSKVKPTVLPNGIDDESTSSIKKPETGKKELDNLLPSKKSIPDTEGIEKAIGFHVETNQVVAAVNGDNIFAESTHEESQQKKTDLASGEELSSTKRKKNDESAAFAAGRSADMPPTPTERQIETSVDNKKVSTNENPGKDKSNIGGADDAKKASCGLDQPVLQSPNSGQKRLLSTTNSKNTIEISSSKSTKEGLERSHGAQPSLKRSRVEAKLSPRHSNSSNVNKDVSQITEEVYPGETSDFDSQNDDLAAATFVSKTLKESSVARSKANHTDQLDGSSSEPQKVTTMKIGGLSQTLNKDAKTQDTTSRETKKSPQDCNSTITVLGSKEQPVLKVSESERHSGDEKSAGARVHDSDSTDRLRNVQTSLMHTTCDVAQVVKPREAHKESNAKETSGTNADDAPGKTAPLLRQPRQPKSIRNVAAGQISLSNDAELGSSSAVSRRDNTAEVASRIRQQGNLPKTNARDHNTALTIIDSALEGVIVPGGSGDNLVENGVTNAPVSEKFSSEAMNKKRIEKGNDSVSRKKSKAAMATSQPSVMDQSQSITLSIKSRDRKEGKHTSLAPDPLKPQTVNDISRTSHARPSAVQEPRSGVQSTWLPSSFQLRPSFAQRNLRELTKARGDWYEERNGQQKHKKIRFFPVLFNELSLSAIARWAAHEPLSRAQSTRQTVDATYRICSNCSKIGHYESECPALSKEEIMRLAVECSNEPLVVPPSNCSVNDTDLYDVVVETCGGYFIEQRATEEIDPIQHGENTTQLAKTSSVVEVDSFQIRAAKTVIGLKGFDTPQVEQRRAVESKSDSKLLVGDVVVWEPAFGDKFDGDRFSGNICVGYIQEIAGDSALVKVMQTLPPSCESEIPSEIEEVLPENGTLQWIPLQILFVNSEEWTPRS